MTVYGNVTYAAKVNVPFAFQSKHVAPSDETQLLAPDSGYNGLSKVIVDGVTSDIDPDITADNIKFGVEILGVRGTLRAELQSKTIIPSASALTYLPDAGYYGFSEFTLDPITADISPNIISENIKKGVSILGVAGTFETGFSVVDSFSGGLTSGNVNKIFKNISIPSNVTAIADNAFNGCAGLESISIPVSVVSIGQNAFDGCVGLAEIVYGGTLEQWQGITIGSGNEALLNAVIRYQGGRSDE